MTGDEEGLFDDDTINDSAIGMHETYLSFLNAGFTEEQAFRIVLETIRAAVENYDG